MFASSRVVLRFFEINRRRLTLSSDGTQPVPRRFASVRFGHRSVFTALVVVVYVVLCGTVRPVIPVFFPIRRVRFLLLLLEIVRCGRSNPIGSLRFAVVVLVVGGGVIRMIIRILISTATFTRRADDDAASILRDLLMRKRESKRMKDIKSQFHRSKEREKTRERENEREE